MYALIQRTLCNYLIFSSLFYSSLYSTEVETLLKALPLLENYTSCSLVNAGVANQVFVVETPFDKKYVLKIFKRKSVDELKKSQYLFDLVRKEGIKVPSQVLSPTSILDETIMVSEFIEGRYISDEHLPQVAEIMASLHRIETKRSEFGKQKDFTGLFERCKDWKHCDRLKRIYEAIDQSYIKDLPEGIIHGDFSYTNLLVSEDSSITLIDFDHLRSDTLLTDLVRSQLFYGFDREGKLKEETLQNFVLAYDRLRPLKAVELENFFSHMKIYLIDVALEMYDHLFNIQDLEMERVFDNPLNCCLDPELIAQEIFSIENLSSICIKNRENPLYPIFFFGLSGVGKTTLIHLISHSELFYIPKFTVTRAPRSDDDKRYFSYLTVEEFKKLLNKGKFLVWMNQNGVYYGYLYEHLIDKDKYPLMNASAYGLDSILKFKNFRVLIDGDWERGLKERNDLKIFELRKKVNELAKRKFFDNPEFLEKMHLIHYNHFGDPNGSMKELKNRIIKLIDHEM